MVTPFKWALLSLCAQTSPATPQISKIPACVHFILPDPTHGGSGVGSVPQSTSSAHWKGRVQKGHEERAIFFLWYFHRRTLGKLGWETVKKWGDFQQECWSLCTERIIELQKANRQNIPEFLFGNFFQNSVVFDQMWCTTSLNPQSWYQLVSNFQKSNPS